MISAEKPTSLEGYFVFGFVVSKLAYIVSGLFSVFFVVLSATTTYAQRNTHAKRWEGCGGKARGGGVRVLLRKTWKKGIVRKTQQALRHAPRKHFSSLAVIKKTKPGIRPPPLPRLFHISIRQPPCHFLPHFPFSTKWPAGDRPQLM